MFSKELEELIEATLQDGILEEHEKQALVKRALLEGVDIAELVKADTYDAKVNRNVNVSGKVIEVIDVQL